MKRVLVFDVPIRTFHWLMVVFFLSAILLANLTDDDSALFPYHMLAGLMLGVLLIFRLVWGIIGTTYARFTTFILRPSHLFGYIRESLQLKTTRYLNHNPASSLAAVIMFIVTIGLIISGLIMVSSGKDDIKDAHELFAQLFVITSIAHVAGVVFHQVRHRDGMITSMLDGKKDPVKGQVPIHSSQAFSGLILLLIVAGSLWFLHSSFDRDTRTLTLFGTELQLGESEGVNNYEDHNDHDD